MRQCVTTCCCSCFVKLQNPNHLESILHPLNISVFCGVLSYDIFIGLLFKQPGSTRSFASDDTKSQWIGRTIEDSIELKKKSPTSHVARVVECKLCVCCFRFPLHPVSFLF